MYPENNNSHLGRNIAIGIIVTLIFGGLLAGCIAVSVEFIKLSQSGKVDQYLAENEEDDSFDYGYYDEDGRFHYYGETEEEGGNESFGYYDEDGEFHYFADETGPDYDSLFGGSTHEDFPGYETGEYFSLPADNRTDGLSYTVDMEEEEYEDYDSDITYIVYDRITVEGDVPNIDFINETINAGWETVLENYEENKKWMDSGEGVVAELEGNIAYMSEDTLSIVYQMDAYYFQGDSYDGDLYLVSLNFDMKTGQLLENTGILEIDEEFAAEFRERSLEQNADSVLDYYYDDEVVELMEDEESLILFYCPQGMEIGVNVEEGWVTVTYPDYKDFLKKM